MNLFKTQKAGIIIPFILIFLSAEFSLPVYAQNNYIALEETSSLPLNDIEIASNILINNVAAVGGIIGMGYIWDLRRKRAEAAYNYLARLYVRLIYIEKMFSSYQDEILNQMKPPFFRRDPGSGRSILVSMVIKQFADQAHETLNFIRSENGQLPAQKGWSEKFGYFVEFLIDCENLSCKEYIKFFASNEQELEKECNLFSEFNLKNIHEMIEMLKQLQNEQESKIFVSHN